MGALSLLRGNRNYRHLFTASAISNLGDGVSALAFPWLATLITRDPLLISLVAFSTRLPWFLLSIPAGVWTDRFDRQRLMVWADITRFGLMGVVIALISGVAAFPVPETQALGMIAALSGLAFLLGCAEVLRDNAAQTALPSVVAKGDLEHANGQMWSVEQIMGSLVGPPLAGVLIAIAVPAAFLLDAVTFALAALLVWRMSFPPRARPARRSMRVEAGEAWAWMRGHPAVLRLAVMLGLLNALNLSVLTMLALYAQEVLELSAIGYGLLLTSEAVGGVLAGVFGPALVARVGRARSLHVALGIIAVAFALIGLVPAWPVVAAALMASMFAGVWWNVVTVSYRQRIIPDALLGRVNALYRFFGWGIMPAGVLGAGWLVAALEPGLGQPAALRVMYLLAGAGGAGLWLYALIRLRDLPQ